MTVPSIRELSIEFINSKALSMMSCCGAAGESVGRLVETAWAEHEALLLNPILHPLSCLGCFEAFSIPTDDEL